MSVRPVPRRDFLARSAAVAAAFAAPPILPARARGANDRVTVGLIGMGRQMRKPNLPQFLALPDAQVVAVCDVDSWRLEQGQADVERHYAEKAGLSRHGGCQAYRDFREVIGRADVDAVMIATPDHWHVPMAIEAMKAGKHVSLEKPLTLCIADGRALSAAAAKHGVVTRTDSEFRSLRPFNQAAELVRNGRLGQLKAIRVGLPIDTPPVPPQPDMPVPPELDYAKWLGPAPEAPYTEKRVHGRHDVTARPNWMRISEYANGMIANWGAHLFDIAQWAMDTEATGPVEVEGTGEFSKGLWNTMVTFEVRYRYANGVTMTARSEKPYIRFEGSEGWVQVDYPGTSTAEPASLLTAPPGAVSFDGTLEDKADFVRAIREKRRTLQPFDVGHRTISISQLGLIAMKLGGTLRWDPVAERFPDDNAANALLVQPQRDWRHAYAV